MHVTDWHAVAVQSYHFGVIIDPCSASTSQSVSFAAVFSALFAFPVSVQRVICQTDRKVAEEVKLHVDTTRIQQQALRLTIGKCLKKCTSMKKQHPRQKGKKSLVCLNISECKGSSQPLNLGSFCHSVSFFSRACWLVPLRAAPCFHILSAPALQSAVVGRAAQPVHFVCLRSNGFSLPCTCYYSCLRV